MRARATAGHSEDTPGPNRWVVFALVSIGIFMSTLDGSIVNIALPVIMEDLNSSLSVIEWVMMIYLLTVSSLLLSFGRLSDIRGRRWVYSRGLLIFAAGSLFCGMASTARWLIAARAFQGVGAAMIMSCTPALVADAFPAAERGKALGMMGTVVASGLTLGPALGGWIVSILSWQFIFYINVPIGIVAAWIVARILKGSAADEIRPEPFDWAGALLLTFSLAPFIYAVSRGYDWGYGSLSFLLLCGLSAAALIGLVIAERHIDPPLIDPAILKIRMFTLPLISAMILFVGLFVLIFLMPFFMIHPMGVPVQHAGYVMVIPFFFLFLLSPISGSLSDRIGSRVLCTVGLGGLSAGLFFLSRLTPDAGFIDIGWPMALAGVGTAIFVPPNNAAIMSAVPRPRVGVASATLAASRNLGMVFGVTLAGTLFNTIFHHLSGGKEFKTYSPEIASTFMTAFEYAMLAGAAVAALGMITSALRGKESRIREKGENKGG